MLRVFVSWRSNATYYHGSTPSYTSNERTRYISSVVRRVRTGCSLWACRLVSSAANSDEDDDDEDDDIDDDEDGGITKNGTMKKRAYATYKKGASKKKISSSSSSSTTVWSGVNPDLSRRAHSLLTPGDNNTGVKSTLDVDDTLVMNGQWECVIVSSLNDDGDGVLAKKAVTTSVGTSNSSMNRGPLTGPPGNGRAVVTSSTLPRAPLGALHKKITASARPLVSTATSIGLRKGLGIVGGGPRKTLVSTASTTTLSASKPPTRH